MPTTTPTDTPTLFVWDRWAAAYAIARGCTLLRAVPQGPTHWVGFELDDTDGAATKSLQDWKRGPAMVPAHEFVQSYREVYRLSQSY